ncbi:EP300-interacting inhibitor of differentiation 3 [Folsomia candida]|uniref:EP300-interacting inhibitor of differentiation 3 n=1 Tax=Folsomia candida TaxID=158441 RepID=UPI000B8F9ED4|nr:EP300-interacting inhibitor of differentiation 3 [Folsomia candida]
MSRSTRAARKRDEPEPEPETSMALASMADESASPPKAPKLLSEDESSEESDDSECGSGTTTVSSVPDATGGALRRKYNKLIDDCRKLEKREGFSSDVQAVMTKNIQSASSLFQQLSHTQPQVASENANRSQIMTETVGSTPGDLYMAFLHTKMISEVLRSKTDSIGASNSGFKMDEFISNVKRKAVTDADDLPAYSSKIVSKFLSMEFAVASKTLPLVTAVVGSFDRDAISVPKEKKPRAPIVRKRFDDVEKTQEEVNLVHYNKSEGPQKLAHHLSRLLRQHTRIHTEPTTLYEFCLDPGSLNKSIESIFYVAFLVHDGVAGLHKLAGSPMKDFAIEVKPEKRTEEDEQQQKQISSRRNTRNQYILSFSARMFKKLCQAASGDPIIPPYATMEGLQAMEDKQT